MSSVPPSPKAFDDVFARANHAWAARDLATATIVRSGNHIGSQRAETHYKRGNALKDLKRFEEACSSYDIATGLKPDSAYDYCNRGTAQQSLGATTAQPRRIDSSHQSHHTDLR